MHPFHFHTSVVLYSPARVKIVAYACEGKNKEKGISSFPDTVAKMPSLPSLHPPVMFST